MSKIATPQEIVKALKKEGIHYTHDVNGSLLRIKEVTFETICDECGFPVCPSRLALALPVNGGNRGPVRHVNICPDRPACRFRQARAEAERVTRLKQRVII